MIYIQCYFVPLGVGTITWSPLAGGILTGKYDDGVPIYSRAALKVSCPNTDDLFMKIILQMTPTENPYCIVHLKKLLHHLKNAELKVKR